MRLPIAAALLLLAPDLALADTLDVRITGIASQAGKVRVAVCERSFDESGCSRGAIRDPEMPTMDVVFDDLPPGRYAIAVYHDQNGNGEMDKMAFGLPDEPYGFSNDIGRLGPPRFEAALVQVAGRTVVEIRVRRLMGGASVQLP